MDSQEFKTLHRQIEVEQKIIHLLLKSRSAVDECIDSGLGSDLFDKNHQHLVRSIYKDFVSSNRNRLLNREAYKHITLETDKPNLIHHLRIFDTCFIGTSADFNDLGFLKKELLEAYAGRQACEFLQKFHNEAKSKGYQFATKNLVDSLQRSVEISTASEVTFASLGELRDSYIEQIKLAKENPAQVIRCGIPEIDDAVNVGFQPGHLTLFVGDVGGHKTNVMLNVALNIAQRGYPILFVPLEMPWKDLLNRVTCNRVGIPNVRLSRPHELTDDDIQKIQNASLWTDKHAEMFCVLDSRERFSVASMRREIEKRIAIFKPRVVIIDYADIFETDVRYGSKTVEIGDMVKSIRHMGRKFGFHVISAAQMNRAAIKSLREGKEEAVDSTAIHGSHSYSADSDTIFGLMKVPGETNRIKIHTIKARHGPSGQTNELTVDPSRYLISSCSMPGITSSESDLEMDMNRNPMEIATFESSPSIEFMSSDFDSLDDMATLGE